MVGKNVWFEGIPWGGDFREVPGDAGQDLEDYEWVERRDWKRFLRPITYVSDWYGGHGGDEFGNCTLYLRTPFGSVIWAYPTCHRQFDVELPMESCDKDGALEWMTRMTEGRESWLECYPNRRNNAEAK